MTVLVLLSFKPFSQSEHLHGNKQPKVVYYHVNFLAYASLSEQMVFQQRSNKPSVPKTIVSLKPVYHARLVQREIGFTQSLANPRIRSVVSLHAIYNRSLPKIEIDKPVPIELLSNKYEHVFQTYTYGDLMREYMENYQKFKPYFYAVPEKNGPMLYEQGYKLMLDHLLKSQELHDSNRPETRFPYQADEYYYNSYRSELIEFEKKIPEEKKKNQKFQPEKAQREIMMKYKPHLKHLHYGLIGIDSQGKDILNKKFIDKFNRLVETAAQELKLPAPSLVLHHIDPCHTSNKKSNGEDQEIGLGMPDNLIRNCQANLVVQFRVPNQTVELLTDFSLKNLCKQERDRFCFGSEVYAYLIREQLNPETPDKPKIEPKPGRLYLSTFDKTKLDYFKQEAAIKQTRQSHILMTNALEDAQQKGRPLPMSQKAIKEFDENKTKLNQLLEQKHKFTQDQRRLPKNRSRSI